jgi:hypothetical protein
MKIFVNHFDKSSFESKLQHLEDLDFTLFIDDIPKSQNDLSSINILVLQEPNEYFGLHDWAIQNKHLFSFILTWSDKVLNNCENTLFLPFGHTWFKSDQYGKNHPKTFQVSHLCGKLLKTYGQSLRHELLVRKNEVTIPTKFFDVYGDRHNIEDARKGKEEVFGDSMFGVAIENTSHRGYFTEKILDCFLLKTIPMYWGCSSINDFFNQDGIIKFENIDDFIYISNNLTEDFYNSKKDIIEENYQKALYYVDYEQNIVNKITEVFKLNNLI